MGGNEPILFGVKPGGCEGSAGGGGCLLVGTSTGTGGGGIVWSDINELKIYFLTMLSAVTESFLARFFVEVAQSERSIEIQRQIVC